MSSISSRLASFARSREKALRAKGMFNMAMAEAVTHIKTVAGYCARMHPEKQLNMVTSVEADILLLIPSELSSFAKLREEMLELLDRAKS